MSLSLLPYICDMERPFDFINQRERPFRTQFLEPRKDALRSWEHVMKPMEHIASAMSHLDLQDVGSKITSDNEKFQVNVDVQHFSPEEITAKVVDKYVIVEGKHEEKEDEHGYISRHFIRRYALPEGCLPDTVKSKLSFDGVLTITAPKVIAMPSIGERIVPITHTGPVVKEPGFPIATKDEPK